MGLDLDRCAVSQPGSCDGPCRGGWESSGLEGPAGSLSAPSPLTPLSLGSLPV